jgi:hypothetical protein
MIFPSTASPGPRRMPRLPICILLVHVALAAARAEASPFIEPGDPSLRSDLQLLIDERVLADAPLVWPMSWNDIAAGLESAPVTGTLEPAVMAALARVREQFSRASQLGAFLHVRAGFTDDAPLIRSFDADNRETSEATFGLSWSTNRFAAEIDLTRAQDAPRDEYRLDGSYFSMALGNWAVGIGRQNRWWGPGWQSSLILSTNARPIRQLSIRKIGATPFAKRWLRWIGPWTLDSFIGTLDDPRIVSDARLFGVRATAKPLPGLTVGLSRTAQFCGDGRVCDLETFGRLLLGKDNTGINVGADEEPGNQLGGIDLRFAFAERPLALYMQWIGEDSRQGGPQIGDWLRQFGVEHWGSVGRSSSRFRVYFEWADTLCREGGFGFGNNDYNCGYEHATFASGYRYEGRSIGHSIDGDSDSVTLGGVINGPSNRSWTALLQAADINDAPPSSRPHGISQTPLEVSQLAFSHRRSLPVGDLVLRLRHERVKDPALDMSTSDTSVSVEWRFGY